MLIAVDGAAQPEAPGQQDRPAGVIVAGDDIQATCGGKVSVRGAAPAGEVGRCQTRDQRMGRVHDADVVAVNWRAADARLRNPAVVEATTAQLDVKAAPAVDKGSDLGGGHTVDHEGTARRVIKDDLVDACEVGRGEVPGRRHGPAQRPDGLVDVGQGVADHENGGGGGPAVGVRLVRVEGGGAIVNGVADAVADAV